LSAASVFAVWRERDALLARLAAGFPEVRFDGVAHPDQFPARALDCDALISFQLRPEWLPRLPRLRWVQSIGAGVDRLLGPPGLPARVQVTRTRGDFEHQLAEYALAAVLHHAGGWPQWAAGQAARRWERAPRALARGRRAGVLGLGWIGGEVARALKSAGMAVWGCSAGGRPHPACERVFAAPALSEFLAGLDYLVVVLPLTPATRGLLDAARLAALPAGAVVINVGRAEVVVEAALAEALESGRLGAAYLDVHWQEPLPADSPWWGRRNAFVTPHIAGVTETGALADEFAENLRRYLAGQPLQHTVDRSRGY